MCKVFKRYVQRRKYLQIVLIKRIITKLKRLKTPENDRINLIE